MTDAAIGSDTPKRESVSSNATETAATSAGTSKSVERIEVTGSHIKRIDLEGPSPISIIELEDIKQSGAASVGDLLRDQTVNSFGSRREKGGGNFWSESSVDLRGLGQARTLVLLNGKRLPRGGNWSVDLNFIPLAAVERVEILRDGGGAIYGTDAVGGVVNIITRKDFDGTAASFKALLPQDPGGESRTYSLYQGLNRDGTNFTFMGSFRDTESLHWNQRTEVYRTENARNSGGMPGNYFDARGFSTAFPNCPPERLLDGVCQNFFWRDSILHPSVQTTSFMGKFDHQLSMDTQLYGRMIASQKTAKYNWGPVQPRKNFSISKAAAQNLVRGLIVNGVDQSNIFDTHSNTRDVTLQFAVEEAGPQVREGTATLYGLGLGAKGIVFNDYDWELYFAGDAANQRDEQTDGAIKKSVIEAQMEAGTYNPFLESGQRGTLVDAEIRPWFTVESISRELHGKVSGLLFNVPAGAVQGALGFMLTSENFNAKRDDALKVLDPDGQAYDGADFTGFDGTGRRQVRSLYAELAVPVIQRFELQLAARWDQYSDFGNTVNPKLAFRYAPFDILYFRGSIGTGFRAPTLDELYRDEYPQYVSFTDAKTGRSVQMYIQGGGNKNLVAEKSRSYSFGLGVQATRSLTLMADYWNMNLIDPISFSQMSALTRAEADGFDISRFATITRDPITNDIIEVVAPYQNLGRKELNGYDLGLNYQRQAPWGGRLSAQSSHSVTLIFKERDWPLAALDNKVGRGRFPRWRNRSSIGWGDQVYGITLSAATIASQRNEPNPDFRVPYYTEYSSAFRYKAPWKADISLSVLNLDNRLPPKNNRASDINERLYSALGRRLSLEYTQNF